MVIDAVIDSPDDDQFDADDDEDHPVRARGHTDQVNDIGGEFVATALREWGFPPPVTQPE